jgi:hypothetical protein
VCVRLYERERERERERVKGGRVVGDRCCVDVPSWKGKRGRLANAKEGRKKTLDAIFGKEKSCWLPGGVGGVLVV